MINLFRIEFLRHRGLAAGCAALHFVVLYYLTTLGISMLTRPYCIFWLLTNIALGGGFGIYQMSLHKRDNNWLYLLHRPLSHRRIFLALTLSGFALTAVMTLVPTLSILLIMDSDGLSGTEARHYKILPFIGAAMLTAYYCGCFARLSASRLGFLALAMTTVYFINIAQMNTANVPVACVLVLWAILLAFTAFKPDLTQPSRKPLSLLLTELPIQYGCLWLLVTMAELSVGLNNYIDDSNSYRNPAEGTDFSIVRLPTEEIIEYALRNSTHPDAAFLLQQVQLGESSRIGNPEHNGYPRRHQMPTYDTGLRLADPERNLNWNFSHSSMLFEGWDTNTNAFAGWLGPDGFHQEAAAPGIRFASVPWVTANEFVLDDHNIYQIDWEAQCLYRRFTKDGHERFANSLTLSENVSTLLSETRLFVFGTPELRDPHIMLTPKAVLETPNMDHPESRRFGLLELIDGYLIFALTGMTPTTIAADFALFGHAQLLLYRTRPGNPNELIANVGLRSGISDSYIYKEFVFAPGMRLLTDLFWGLNKGKRAEQTLPLLYFSFPPRIWLLTGLSSVFCVVLTAWLLRRSAVPLRVKLFWIIGNAFTGFAGLLSFLLGSFWGRPERWLLPVTAPGDEK